MSNIHWIETSLNKKILRVVLASCLLIPSWFFYIYFYDFLESVSNDTLFINEYLSHAIHFFLVYFLIFGFAPYYIFSKIKLTNSSATNYTALGDI